MAHKGADDTLSPTLESNWTMMRQMAAERVLTRHLEHIEQREHGHFPHRRNSRDFEREMRSARRLRSESMRVDSTEPRKATARRRSLPSGPPRPDSPPTHATRSPKRGISEEEGTSDLLDLMTSTLREAQEVEESRPSLFLQTRNSTNMVGSKESMPARRKSLQEKRITLENPPVRRHQSLRIRNGHGDDRPPLHRGEKLIKMKDAQVLSFDESADDNKTPHDVTPSDFSGLGEGGATESPTRTTNKNGTENFEDTSPKKTPQETRSGMQAEQTQPPDKSTSSASLSDTSSQASSSKKSTTQRKAGNADVEFYDEYVGFTSTKDKDSKDNGGVTPQSLSLPLKDLSDDNSDDEGDKSEGSDNEMNTPREGRDSWRKVRKCRYIRGYNPPELIMPDDTVSFVFGGK